jgi:2,3-bisphosphoglycerate-dependent phosphoglycerate mutase
MQLYFIRHGQSENNLLWVRTGSSVGRSQDPALTRLGRQQAELLAQHLRRTESIDASGERDLQNVSGFAIAHLYTSLMIRSIATGTIIARTLDLPLVAWEEVHERGGIYLKDEQTGERIGQAGANRAYFETHYPDLVLPDSLDEDGWWSRPFEEYEQALARARRFLRDLSQRHGDTTDRVAVISHGGFYNCLLAGLLRLPQPNGYWFALNNAAITRMDFRPEGVSMIYANRVSFLPKELVT